MATPGRGLRVLLVDDDASGRETAASVLQGFEVSTFASGAEAVAALTLDSNYDAVVANLCASHLNGMDLYWVASICWPELSRKFVFVVDDLENSRDTVGPTRLPVVSKPYARFELVNALLRAVVPRRAPPRRERRKSSAALKKTALTPEKSLMSDANAGKHRCVECEEYSPQTETEYTLISARHGWRLSPRLGPGGRRILEWRCPACWAKRKGSELHL